ncbi:MAG: FAD-dependent oxidoreductase [Clostridia bacterium]|nr:FAD-dependent oxidoreductase [Clostridia bacterium]
MKKIVSVVLTLMMLMSMTVAFAEAETTCDVVVIGAGGAGMTAAIKADNAGAKVVLLEKEASVGGNTKLGSSVYNAVGSKLQIEAGIEGATVDAWVAKLHKGNPANEISAITFLAENSGASADWLCSIGMDLTRLFNTFGHGPADGSAPGYPMVVAMENELKNRSIDYRVNAEATKILRDEAGAVCGVEVNGEYTIACKAVVVTSGGFAANNELVTKFDPRWEGLSFSCSASATGEGTVVAMEAGAAVSHMTNVKVNPTAYYLDEKNCISAAPFRINGCIQVSHAGVRVVNEEGAYTPNSEAIVNAGGETYMIFDQTLVDKVAASKTYEQWFVKADTLEELADKIDVDKEAFLKTCADFTTYAKNGSDPDFGKKNFTTDLTNAPYYALLTKPAVQGTFGGITVNAAAEVLDEAGNVIPGMYAAGECADEGTMGDAPLTVNVVFGTLAGENAAAFVK